jgi:hypothetical protein
MEIKDKKAVLAILGLLASGSPQEAEPLICVVFF